MDLTIQDGQKTREGPLIEGGIRAVSEKKRKNFLNRGSQTVLGVGYRKVGMSVTLRETIRA